MSRRFKLVVTLAAVAFSGGVITSHFSGTIYPSLPLCVAAAAVLLVVGGIFSRARTSTVVASIVALSVSSILYCYLFPASMYAFDPDAHAVQSQVIMTTGSLQGTLPGFYHFAALFQILPAQVSLLGDLPIDVGYAIYPLVVGFGLPLFAVVLTRRLTFDKQASIVAAAVAGVGGSVIKYGYAPIPIVLGAVYVAGTVAALSLSARRDRIRYLAVGAVFAVAAALTHKVALLLIVGTVVVFTTYTGLVALVTRERTERVGVLLLISVLLLVVQWTFLTDYIGTSLVLVGGVVEALSNGLFVEQTRVLPPAAVPVSPPLTRRMFNTLYFFVSVGIGGVAAVELFRRHKNWETRTLQSAALVTVGFSLPGIVIAAAPGFQRVYVYAIAFVGALVGTGISRFSSSGRALSKPVAVVLLIVVLLVNPLSAAVWPDTPGVDRQYLNAEEVAGKEFADGIDHLVPMDMFYGDETIDFEQAAATDVDAQKTVPQPQWRSELLSDEFLNGTLADGEYEYVVLRTDIDLYRFKGGRYRLTWDPEGALNGSYSRLYSNGGVAIYKRGR